MSNATTETVTTVTTTTEIKFKDDLVTVSDKFAPLITGNVAAAKLEAPDSVYFDHAPEGITPASYDLHRKWDDLFQNGMAKAGVGKSVEIFAANPKLEELTLVVPIHGKDTYEATFKRHGTSRNPSSGEISNYVGNLAVSRVNIVSTRTKAESSAIKAEFKSLAAAAGL